MLSKTRIFAIILAIIAPVAWAVEFINLKQFWVSVDDYGEGPSYGISWNLHEALMTHRGLWAILAAVALIMVCSKKIRIYSGIAVLAVLISSDIAFDLIVFNHPIDFDLSANSFDVSSAPFYISLSIAELIVFASLFFTFLERKRSLSRKKSETRKNDNILYCVGLTLSWITPLIVSSSPDDDQYRGYFTPVFWCVLSGITAVISMVCSYLCVTHAQVVRRREKTVLLIASVMTVIGLEGIAIWKMPPTFFFIVLVVFAGSQLTMVIFIRRWKLHLRSAIAIVGILTAVVLVYWFLIFNGMVVGYLYDSTTPDTPYSLPWDIFICTLISAGITILIEPRSHQLPDSYVPSSMPQPNA